MPVVFLDDIVELKKPHVCGAFRWQVIRTGADIKLRCQGCGRVVMLDCNTFTKRLKKVVSNEEQP